MADVRTWVNRVTGTITNRITIRIEKRLSMSGMVEGICSKYVRDGEPIPLKMSQKSMLELVRDEYEYQGTAHIWTWSDEVNYDAAQDQRALAEALIIATFPEMADNRG